MKYLEESLIEFLKEKGRSKYVTRGRFGIEKENLRVNPDGKLSLTEHPEVFGDKKENPYIKTDFSESQVEVITPALKSIREVYDYLENLTDIVNNNIGQELLWPQSAPAILPEEKQILLANFGEGEVGEREIKYREFLSERYGKKVQMISGIHYNFSFDDKLIKALNTKNEDFKEFKNKIYMKVARNIMLHRWFLIYLTGASPFMHESYDKEHLKDMERVGEVLRYGNSTSLRNGFCGYRNEKDFLVPWTSVKEYNKKIKELVSTGELSNAREFYSAVRLKGKDNKNLLESIEKDGVLYMELRLLDINPFDKNGISLKTAYLIHLFILLALLSKDCEYDEYQQKIAEKNHDIIVNEGLSKEITLYTREGNEISIEEFASHILGNMERMVDLFDFKDPLYREAIEDAREMINDRTRTLAYRVNTEVGKRGFMNFHLETANKYKEDSYDNDYILHGFEDLELSTQILMKESIKRGLNIEIVDRDDNFITIANKDKKEYVKQATKTSKDSYITVLIMENKVVTKKILEENGIPVPKGKTFADIEEAKESFEEFNGKGIVIKPKSTNYGVGITIFKNSYTRQNYEEAIDIAFSFDNSIIVEEFVKGDEYRFLVIGDEVLAITQRVAANVVGDGKSSIRELVEIKNRDKLRGTGHRKPLEKIELGKIEKLLLESEGKTFDYIPEKDEIVRLRENSNISTGGDSVDFTDEIHNDYKKLAVEASKIAKAKFCGVDILIEDIKAPMKKDGYSIIELNFNPAYYMHCYPYKGKRRNVAEKILKVLELI